MRRLLTKTLWSKLLLLTAAVSTVYGNFFADEVAPQNLRWKNSAIKISLSNSLLNPNLNVKIADGDTAEMAVRRSLETWEKAANVKFEIVPSERQAVSPAGKSGDAVNLITIAPTSENILLFSKDAESVSARTRVFFNTKGYITEADIVLNPYQQFSTDGSLGTFDLESVLTHEIGHLLGLEHSSVFSATMNENNGKNGVFSLPNIVSRTLAASDAAAIRAIYGAKDEPAQCCGAVAGKLTNGGGKAAKNHTVWAEESNTGRVSAEVTTAADGIFRLEGLAGGAYRIYAQSSSNEKNVSSAEEIGKVEVVAGKTAAITKTLSGKTGRADLQYVGFNGQLSQFSVPINGGKSFVIYLGGKNLDAGKLKIAFSSPFLKIASRSIAAHDYGESVSVLSFEVRAAENIPGGEYSISIEDEKGVRRFVVGALTVEEFINPWSGGVFPYN